MKTMILKTFMRKIKEAHPMHTAEVWIKIGNASYLVRDVEIDDEGDLIVRVGSTPY